MKGKGTKRTKLVSLLFRRISGPLTAHLAVPGIPPTLSLLLSSPFLPLHPSPLFSFYINATEKSGVPSLPIGDLPVLTSLIPFLNIIITTIKKKKEGRETRIRDKTIRKLKICYRIFVELL